MFYKLRYDMERLDELFETGKCCIDSKTNNLDEIEYGNIRKGRFHTIPRKEINFEQWPVVNFYYSSEFSDRQEDYLLNIEDWPIMHERVKNELEKNQIKGVNYYPICLIDTVTGKMIDKYYFMYVTRFIDAYDMNKSEYSYNQKYDAYFFKPMRVYLNQSVCEGEDVFRCKKEPVPIYVSERFRQIIQENGFSGFCFVPQP